jgi:hypothetical protein
MAKNDVFFNFEKHNIKKKNYLLSILNWQILLKSASQIFEFFVILEEFVLGSQIWPNVAIEFKVWNSKIQNLNEFE